MRKLVVGLFFIVLIGLFVKSCIPIGKESVNTDMKYVAVIKIQGPLYSSSVKTLAGRINGADEIMRQLILARKDDSVAAVLLRMDTPGGSVTASEEIATEIYKLKETGKPVVTSMGDVSASAGYWLSSCTDYIFANPSTLTGSIGVYIPYTNVEELYKKIGISQDRIKSGQYKDIMSPDRPMTNEERVILQNMVNEMYDNFIKQVSKGRNLSEEEVRKLADGRIYTGSQAKELKLVDAIGNYYDALDWTAKKAGIEGEVKVKVYEEPFSLQDIFMLGMIDKISLLFDTAKPNDLIEQKGFY